MKKIAYLTLYLTLLLLAIMTPQNTNAATLAPHLYKEKLDNGLTLLVKEVPGSKVATVQVWVKAGSIYEGEKEGGITHLIEHMIFKGTETRGTGEVAAEIEGIGGQINAYTSFENTVYHATLSARHWATALEVLNDAILHSVYDADELEREKLVVLEEVRMRNDRPSIKLFQEMMSNSYTKHPYMLPVIGTAESVSSFSRDDIIRYMSEHYFPENFTVVIVGDVRFDPVAKKVKKLFGHLPSKSKKEIILEKEPLQKEARFFKIEDDISQANMALSFHIPAFDNEDTAVIDVISNIVGNGETSRLYNILRNEKGLVYQIGANAFTPKYPGLFKVSAALEAGKIKEALEVTLEELFKLKYIKVEESELERVKLNLESDFVFNLEKVEGQASVLGTFNALKDDPREDEYLEQIRNVSKTDILNVAQKYFNGRNLTTGYIAPKGSEVGLDQAELVKLVKKAENAAKKSIPSSLLPNSYMSDTHYFEMENGIRLLVREDANIPTVAIRAIFPGGLRGEELDTNGAFAFISELLPKGTKKLNSRDFSLKLADMAGDISGFNGKNTFGLKAGFLSKFFKEGLALVRDVIVTPAFDEKEAKKIIPERLAAIKQQEDSLPALAFREFNRILFQGHPYGLNTMGTEEAISNMRAKSLHSLYRKFATPDNLVLSVAGKVKALEVKKEVARLFANWKVSKDSQNYEDFLPPDLPDGPKIFNIARDKEQVHIIIGFLGTTLNSQDRIAVEVLDTVLSGQSGRLFRQLRDKQSLAYSLSAFSLLGLDTGSFGIYIGTSPDKKEEAIQSTWKELARVRDVPVEEEELKKAKNILVGKYELSLQTHGSQAMEMALNQTYNLGQDFGNRYVHEVSQISPEEIQEAARKYIQPDNYVLVTVGAEK